MHSLSPDTGPMAPSPGSEPMTDEILLLPMPQRLQVLPGRFRLRDDALLLLKGEPRAELLRLGHTLRGTLRTLGKSPALTTFGVSTDPRVQVLLAIDPAQVRQPEGYRLEITPAQLSIIAHDGAGAFYAAMTLRQLARWEADSLPALRIEDWPDLPNRGVMLDVSRDMVPRMGTLMNLIDSLAEWKINQFQLYTEHTFAYRDDGAVWADASPFTPQQILDLDQYCRERFIQLVPNRNSFGHMERWLRRAPYRALAELPEGESATLNPLDPGSIQLVARLYQELLPHFTSRLFNVGCDETFELGKGRSRAECERRGPGRVYLDYLLKIHRLVQHHGRTMMFWGDIVQQHPDLIAELPRDVIALEWGYEHDHPFPERCEKYVRAGVPFYICPGTSSWCSFAGRTDNAVANLRAAADNARRFGASGYLITDWGDYGHLQYLPTAWLGFACGAALAWSLEANDDLNLPRALDRHVFLDRARRMGRIVHQMGNVYTLAGERLHNRSMIFQQYFRPGDPVQDEIRYRMRPHHGEQAIEALDELMNGLHQTAMQRPDAQLLIDEFTQAGAFLKHGCHYAIARGGGTAADLDAAARRELTAELTRLIAEHRRLWTFRARSGGLEASVARLEAQLQVYRQ